MLPYQYDWYGLQVLFKQWVHSWRMVQPYQDQDCSWESAQEFNSK